MKQITSTWILTALLVVIPIISIAQTSDNEMRFYVRESNEQNGSFIWCNSDSLSLIFTRRFKQGGAPFEVRLSGTVSADGTPELVVKQIKPLSKSSNHDNWMFGFTNRTLHNDISAWVKNNIIRINSYHSTQVEEPTPIELWLCYYPLYYAQTGDTLYYMAYDKSMLRNTVTGNPFSIIDKKTPKHYLLVDRDGNKLILNYYDSTATRPFYVERYKVHTSPKKVIREGYSAYLNPDGKTLMRHCYLNDSLTFSEKLNNWLLCVANAC